MKYTERTHAKLSAKDKKRLEAIKKENPHITNRSIFEEFINNYCETEPKGIKLKIKQLETDKKEIEYQINNLYEDKTKLEIEIQTYKDKLNKTLDNYIDTDLTKALESIDKISKDQNFYTFEDIPESTFTTIAKNNKIDVETLKKNVLKELF